MEHREVIAVRRNHKSHNVTVFVLKIMNLSGIYTFSYTTAIRE